MDTVQTDLAESKERLAVQKSATNLEKSIRQAAQREISSLADTARLLFTPDDATLTALGLQTRYVILTEPETGDSIKRAKRASKSTAELINRWRLLVTNAAKLEPEEQAQLTTAGWGAARIAAASDLVEAYVHADIAQQSAIQQYRQAKRQYSDNIAALRQWYGRARGLTLLAIRDKDPATQQYIRDLLGLNG